MGGGNINGFCSNFMMRNIKVEVGCFLFCVSRLVGSFGS